MKLAPRKREQGSVLVISIVTCLVIATVLASYLALISTRYRLTVRSMGWNAAIPILEAGIEEAMTHLHDDDGYPTANGWAASVVGGQSVHTKLRNFSDGSYFTVTLYNSASTNPIIYSSGFVPAPLGQGYISRTVRVTATKAIKTFPAGISANGKVTLNSGIFDSYNSCLGAYSTNSNGLGTNGAIATNSQLVPAVAVAAAKIYGTVTTGALGTVTTTSGSVGDKDWNATHSGIQTGWSDNDMNVAFPTNAAPAGPFLPIPSPTAQGGSNVIFLGSGSYSSATTLTVNANTNTPPLVVNGNAILYLKAATAIAVSGTGYIKINPGASLTMYVEGTTATISGAGIINGDGLPANFSYIGLSGNKTFSLSGSSGFFGTINAPQAALSVSGTTTAIYGAAIVSTYFSNTGAGFHYDECLGVGGSGLLTITSWVEL